MISNIEGLDQILLGMKWLDIKDSADMFIQRRATCWRHHSTHSQPFTFTGGCHMPCWGCTICQIYQHSLCRIACLLSPFSTEQSYRCGFLQVQRDIHRIPISLPPPATSWSHSTEKPSQCRETTKTTNRGADHTPFRRLVPSNPRHRTDGTCAVEIRGCSLNLIRRTKERASRTRWASHAAPRCQPAFTFSSLQASRR